MARQEIKTLVRNLLVGFVLLFSITIALPNHAFMQAVYDCGTYSNDAYDANCPEDDSTVGGGTGGKDGGGSNGEGDLSGTGENAKIYGIIGVTCIVLSAGLFIAQRKKSQKKS